MKLSEILAGVAEPGAAAAAIEIGGVTADSRAAKPGDLFVAISGNKTDGLRFAADAAKARRGRNHFRTGRSGRCGRTLYPCSECATCAVAGCCQALSAQPGTIAAITGTSGKTSVAAFTRQIWEFAGYPAASIGTIGIVSPKGETYGSLTTPDPVDLHRTLDKLAGEGVDPSGNRSVLARPRPAPARRRSGFGRRLHQSQPRPSRLSSRSRILFARQASSVRRIDSAPAARR